MASIQENAISLYKYLSLYKYPISLEKILDHFEYSKKTFFRARNKLESFDIKVLSIFQKGYILDDAHRGLIEFGGALINQQDLISLWRAIEILEPIASRHNLNHMTKSVLDTLQTILPEEYNQKLDIIDYFSHGERIFSNTIFQTILSALFTNKRIKMKYYSRNKSNNKTSFREISPQKILRYRSNWYLIAYCHWRQGLRLFSFDNIQNAEIIDKNIFQLSTVVINQYYQETYGIFSGKQTDTAVLKFYSPTSLWIKNEYWHPNQKGFFNKEDQSYELSIPIGENLTELVMELAKYGQDLNVIKPMRLKQSLLEHHRKAFEFYKK